MIEKIPFKKVIDLLYQKRPLDRQELSDIEIFLIKLGLIAMTCDSMDLAALKSTLVKTVLECMAS